MAKFVRNFAEKAPGLVAGERGPGEAREGQGCAVGTEGPAGVGRAARRQPEGCSLSWPRPRGGSCEEARFHSAANAMRPPYRAPENWEGRTGTVKVARQASLGGLAKD